MKTKVTIRLGRVEDAPAIMRFMGEHWRKGHILSLSRELLLHEFAEGNLLNFALAWRDDRLVGLFGFIRYNQRPVPDLAGSLWKVIASEKTPLLGIRLRRFVMDNVPHRFFAAPGAGPQTRPIYQIIGLEWKTMDHWFMLNPERNPEHCRLIRFERFPEKIGVDDPLPSPAEWSIQELVSANELGRFPFSRYHHVLPYKDESYVRHRFFRHPIYRYRVWHLQHGDHQALFITRMARHEDAAALRVVDFYGDESCLPLLGIALRRQLVESGAEYADFIASGLNTGKMEQAGFTLLDLDQTHTIVPNYFEPFEQKNVPIHCVHDPVPEGFQFRMFRADGDQDRPSELRIQEDDRMNAPKHALP